MPTSLDFAALRAAYPIADVLRARGFSLRRAGKCLAGPCPIHREQRGSSFAVWPDKGRWRCFGKCARGGDMLDLLAALDGTTPAAAARRLAGWQPLHSAGSPLMSRRAHPASTPRSTDAPISSPANFRPPPRLPVLREGTEDELARLSVLRGIARSGLVLATRRGLLRFATLRGVRAWVVVEAARLNAQARRLDGMPWAHLPGTPKAWTLPGSHAARPVGLPPPSSARFAVLTEGGGDLLAACALLAFAEREDDGAACAMLGASARIPADAAATLTGRHVRIVPHRDPAGAAALRRWAADLRAAGAATVDALDLEGWRGPDGAPAKDLNEAMCGANADTLPALAAALIPFALLP